MFENYSTLKVGDKVFEVLSGYRRNLSLGTVARTTPTQIVLSNGAKYNRRTGHEVGSSGKYTFRYIELFDQARWDSHVAEVRERSMRNTLQLYDWQRVPLSVVEAAYAVLPKIKQEAPNEGTSNSSSGNEVR